jgi:hypothetical protein
MLKLIMLGLAKLIVLISFVCPLVFSENLSDSKIIEASLTRPPGIGPTKVSISFQLQGLHEVDDESETFQFSGMIRMRWQDSRQAFNPASVGITEKIYQGNFQFDEIAPAWFPQLVLINDTGSYSTKAVTLKIDAKGNCELYQSISAQAKTGMNLIRYPFDQQSLKARFEVPGYNKNQLLLVADEIPYIQDSVYIDVPQWDLKGADFTIKDFPNTFDPNNPNSTFVLTLNVKRESFFIIRLVVIPLAIIVALSWSVFWMERSSLGDRINVSFIGILTGVTYQLVMAGIMPHISYVTFINAFNNVSSFMMVATVLVNLLVGSLDKRGQVARGDKVDRICRWLFPTIYIVLLLVITIIIFPLY